MVIIVGVSYCFIKNPRKNTRRWRRMWRVSSFAVLRLPNFVCVCAVCVWFELFQFRYFRVFVFFFVFLRFVQFRERVCRVVSRVWIWAKDFYLVVSVKQFSIFRCSDFSPWPPPPSPPLLLPRKCLSTAPKNEEEEDEEQRAIMMEEMAFLYFGCASETQFWNVQNEPGERERANERTRNN